MIISFGWTADLLPPHGCKQETRRRWTKRTLKTWQSQWEQNPEKLHAAFNRSPRSNGQQIGWIQLAGKPYQEPLSKITALSVEREGHPELTELGEEGAKAAFLEKYFPKVSTSEIVAVVPFKFIPSNPRYFESVELAEKTLKAVQAYLDSEKNPESWQTVAKKFGENSEDPIKQLYYFAQKLSALNRIQFQLPGLD